METFFGILIPFLGTTLGAACVFFMKKSLSDLVRRSLAGFAAGVMVAASIGNEFVKMISLIFLNLTNRLKRNLPEPRVCIYP